MNAHTQRLVVAGPAGAIECALDVPNAAAGAAASAARGIAVICHPHPQHGGTMDNKVVQTLARALLQLGYRTLRFNFRGVGASEGAWDEGRGEVDDALAVVAAQREAGQPLVLAGFSFGGYVAAQAASQLPAEGRAERLILVGPSTQKQQRSPGPGGHARRVTASSTTSLPLSATLAWARPQSLPVVVVPGGGHFFTGSSGCSSTSCCAPGTDSVPCAPALPRTP